MRKMALVPYSYGRNDLERLFDMTDRFFADRFLDRRTTPVGEQQGLGLDFYETPHGYYLELDVPGVPQEALDISIEGTRLTLKASRPAPAADDRKYFRSERFFGELQRVIDLPAEVDVEKIEASLKEGVLTLYVPKADTKRPRTIPVTVA